MRRVGVAVKELDRLFKVLEGELIIPREKNLLISPFSTRQEFTKLIYNEIENARNGRTWNYGPLGGFFNMDLNAGYHVNDNWTVGVSVTNLFDSEVRQFVASPEIGRLFMVELKYHLPIGKN